MRSFRYLCFAFVLCAICNAVQGQIILVPLKPQARKEDSLRLKKYTNLENEKVTDRNIGTYLWTARSHFAFEHFDKAEKMLKAILDFSVTPYKPVSLKVIGGNVRLDSAILTTEPPASSDVKYSAAISYTKLLILTQRYNDAEVMFDKVLNKYEAHFICGTGYSWTKREERDLQRILDVHFGRIEKDLDVLIPEIFKEKRRRYAVSDAVIAIKNKYSKEEVKLLLNKAIASITCSVDTAPSTTYITVIDGGTKRKLPVQKTLGKGMIDFFGYNVALPVPFLKNGQSVSAARYKKDFMRSTLYFELKAYSTG